MNKRSVLLFLTIGCSVSLCSAATVTSITAVKSAGGVITTTKTEETREDPRQKFGPVKTKLNPWQLIGDIKFPDLGQYHESNHDEIKDIYMKMQQIKLSLMCVESILGKFFRTDGIAAYPVPFGEFQANYKALVEAYTNEIFNANTTDHYNMPRGYEALVKSVDNFIEQAINAATTNGKSLNFDVTYNTGEIHRITLRPIGDANPQKTDHARRGG